MPVSAGADLLLEHRSVLLRLQHGVRDGRAARERLHRIGARTVRQRCQPRLLLRPVTAPAHIFVSEPVCVSLLKLSVCVSIDVEKVVVTVPDVFVIGPPYSEGITILVKPLIFAE